MRTTTEPILEVGTSVGHGSWLRQLVQNVNGIFVPPPATSSSIGTQGDVAFDSNYMYYCTAPNTWKRVAISTF